MSFNMSNIKDLKLPPEKSFSFCEKVLDHGEILYVDHMGTDEDIVIAARVSYGNEDKKSSGGSGLINYLMRHGHTSPFEMCELKLQIKAPIFVARQWMRHRTASYNEYSGRYSEIMQENYCPSVEEVRFQSKIKRQCGEGVLPKPQSENWRDCLQQNCSLSRSIYDNAISSLGIVKETARIGLPVSSYTRFIFKMDLNNLFHFMHLRSSEYAQYEIRQYSEKIERIVEALWPISYAAWVNYKKEGINISLKEQRLLSKVFIFMERNNIKIDLDDPKAFTKLCGESFSQGEVKEFQDKLNKINALRLKYKGD